MLRFRNGYGMSEMVAAGIVPHPDTAKRTMAKGSIGQVEDTIVSQCHILVSCIISINCIWQVMAGMEGRVISLETGDDVSPGEEGEILLKGPNVMVMDQVLVLVMVMV